MSLSRPCGGGYLPTATTGPERVTRLDQHHNRPRLLIPGNSIPVMVWLVRGNFNVGATGGYVNLGYSTNNGTTLIQRWHGLYKYFD